MRLLVTGGAGFIGSHFVKRMLAAGEEVVVLDKFTYAGNPANLPEDVQCHRGDIAVREDVVVLDKFTYAGNPANLPEDVQCHRGDIAVR